MTAPQIFGIVIDLVCVLLVVLMLISGWKKGFVSMLVRLLSVAAGAVGGFLASHILSPMIYDRFLATPLEEKVSEAIQLSSTTEALSSQLLQGYESLPGFFRQCIVAVVGDVETKIADLSALSQTELPRVLNDEILRPSATLLLGALIFLVVFLVVCLLLKGVAKKLEGHWNIPLIGTANSLLGALAGALRGVIFALVFLALAWLVILLSGGSIAFLNEETTAQSVFLDAISRFFAKPL